jgi:GNAT superfamily N-acetyltransferase
MKAKFVVIRRASKRDAPEIIRLWVYLMNYHKRFGRKVYRYKKNCVSLYRKYLMGRLHSRNAAVFIAELDGEIIGHVMTSIKKVPPVYLVDKEGYVDEIFVKEGQRGKGIAGLLLGAAEGWCMKKKLQKMSVGLNVKNTQALAAYKKFGFSDYHLSMRKQL